jgi:hypothetical protein
MLFTDESITTFLSVGVQLLPVLWLVLAIETTWLRSLLRRAETAPEKKFEGWARVVGTKDAARFARIIVAYSFFFGAPAECLALLALWAGGTEGWLASVVALFLYAALVSSVIASAIAMYRAIVTAEREASPSPPPSTT